MTRSLAQRGLWLASIAAFVAALLWLDQNRGGPASTLSRCNLLLSRSAEPPADVLIVGSSRTGAALDPIAMQDMLAHALPASAPTVERMALGHNPLRASLALLQNYVETRGAPGVVALEIMFMTPRSVDRLAQRGLGTSPEQYIFRRDLNLMTYEQILALPAVAMPYSEEEGWINRLRFRLRGAVLRAGALTYQFLRSPKERWELAACDEQDWTREPGWPTDFAFSYGSFRADAAPDVVVDELEAVMAEAAIGRTLKPWQTGVSIGQDYPYDFGAAYREGEVALLRSMLELAERHDVRVVLLPLPLYGYVPGAEDLRELRASLPPRTQIFDLYGQVRGDLDRFWYDDGHLEHYPAGALTTAILTRHLLSTELLHDGLLAASVPGQRLD